MTNPAFNPDDPRLTAFALGELDGADRTEIEQLIAASPEAAAAIRDIEQTIGVLNGGLAAEPAPELTEEQRASILSEEAVESKAASSADSNSESAANTPQSAKPVARVAAASALAGAVEADDLPQDLLQSPSARSFPWAIAGSLVASAAVMLAVVSWMPDVNPLSDMAMTPPAMESADDQVAMHNVAADRESLKGRGRFSFGEGAESEEATSMAESAQEDTFRQESAAGEAPDSFDRSEKPGFTGPGGASTRRSFPRASSVARTAQPDPESARKLPGQSGSQKRLQNNQEAGSTGSIPLQALPLKKQGEGQAALASAGATPESKPKAAPAPGLPLGKPATEAPARGGAGNGRPGRNFAAGRQDGQQKGGERTEAKSARVASVPQRPGESAPGGFVPAPSDIKEKSKDRMRGLDAVADESYEPIVENAFVEPLTKLKRLSTFSIDVDTASYSNVRRFLNQGQIPPPNAVRIEELVNYFTYDYAEPKDGKPFVADVEVNRCPWAPNHRLARIGIKARTIDKTKRPPTSLVFMIDVSGSMRSANKLALVKQSVNLLVNELTEDDQVAVVAYANDAGLRLDATSGSKRDEIMKVVNGLTAGGSTNGEGGIRTAYDTAIKHFIQGGSNRVIMCTDGDFNVGINNNNELVQLIEEKAASGVFLSIFGFGMGNLKDARLEKLADKGNGHYGYMDNLREAQKVFRDELMGTLYTVAKDVKVQVEFNPATVGAYRLIGYENRKLAAQDFNDDTKDAGEIGAGHVVTALYEIVPKKTWDERPDVGDLRYAQKNQDKAEATVEKLPFKDELMFVKLNYKKPDEETSTSNPGLNIPVKDAQFGGRTTAPSEDFMWAASVASFGMNLRGSQYRGSWSLADVQETVEGAKGEDDLRIEFAGLVKKAMSLIGPQPQLRRPNIPKEGLVPPAKLTPAEARLKATVDNKYRRLVKKINVPNDLQSFGGFYDYGQWDGHAYAGHNNLPTGHWVYVYPSWYIWGEEIKCGKAQADPAAETPPEKPRELPPKPPVEPNPRTTAPPKEFTVP
ncbi:MAG: von Willebrand factor type A domain-containing protein, partial [Planctomycetes bacterium]|nr:von Willebrand factor type A domain-containing protein [Planctomycetota bacterium]